jgi:HTH-type transcriptional regulator, sugar sensing transcriptional regulator
LIFEQQLSRNMQFYLTITLLYITKSCMATDNEREYIDSLVGLGLSMREAKLYLGLLTRHDFTANEIAKQTKLSRPATYDLLNKLARLGICQEKPGKIKRFQAVAPAIALSRLVDNKTSELRAVVDEGKSKIEFLAPLLDSKFAQSRGPNDPFDYFEILRDRKLILKRFLDLQENVKEEWLSFVKPPFTMSSDANTERRVGTVVRGVKMKTIVEYNGNYEETVNYYSKLLPGEEKKIVKHLPSKLMIFDRKITLLGLNDPVSGMGTLVTLYVDHKDFAQMMIEVFNSVWEKAFTAIQLMENRALIE